MLIRILILCFAVIPSLVGAKQLSHTYKTHHANFNLIKSYDRFSKQGIISLKPCPTCEEQQFTLHANTYLAENGVQVALEDLMKISLANKSDHILVQINKYNKKVYYIEWGYPEGEPEDSE